MPKQHELNALTKGRKSEVEKFFTGIYQKLQKPDLFDGLQKTYQPLNEEGEKLPPEAKSPQLKIDDLIQSASEQLIPLYDLIVSQDTGNQKAMADIVVDEKVILKDVPAVTILFLQKQVNDLQTFISQVPTPDPAERWTYDSNLGMLATAVTQTHRTKKQAKVIVKSPATTQHPAQTEMVQEDVLAGYWSLVRYTTRMPADTKAHLLVKLRKLQDALKVALQKANDVTTAKREIGFDLLKYVFGDAIQKK